MKRKPKNPVQDQPPIDKPKCGAKLRKKDAFCRHRAGMRTDHEGMGRCYLHGGLTPVKHGRYSKVTNARLGTLIEEFLAGENPLDLTEEVALLRAMTVDLVNRWDDIYGPDGALLAWHESFKQNPNAPSKPRQLPDFSSISAIVDKTGSMVDRIQKHKQEGAVTLATLAKVLEQFGVEVAMAVSEMELGEEVESKLLGNIEQRWKQIRIEGK